MNKKLLVFSTQLMETGGIESHILEFCHQMSNAGIDITLVVPNFSMNAQDESKLRQWCKQLYVNSGKAGYRTMSWLLYTAVRLNITQYDAVYTNGQGESIGMFAQLILRKKHWVHHHHTAGDAADQATWGKRYWNALRTAGNLVACSFKNAGDMKLVLNRDINVVPVFSRKITGVDQEKQPGSLINLGYYGRLIKEKGIDIICRFSSDQDCTSIQFHIWGEGKSYPPAFFNAYPNLKFHGTFQGTEALAGVIGTLDGFLLISSHPEGLPVCLLECMGAGLPWLATNKGGISDIACDPVSTRVIDPGSNYDEIKRHVLNFAGDLQSGLISQTRQIALYNERFSATSLVSKWKQILNIKAA